MAPRGLGSRGPVAERQEYRGREKMDGEVGMGTEGGGASELLIPRITPAATTPRQISPPKRPISPLASMNEERALV